MFSIAATQLTETERDDLSNKAGKALLATPAVFRAMHGDPGSWSAAEFDGYLTACDAITATTATAADSDPDTVDFATVAGQDALADIINTLAATADNELDAEDLAHYQGLLLAPVTRLTDRRTTSAARGWAA
jgi:hypothetical protein